MFINSTKNRTQNEIVERSISVLENKYEQFSKKNFEGIVRELGISKEQLKEVYDLVEKLNPFPASNFSKTPISSYITPDFLINIVEDKNTVVLTKRNGKDLKVNSSYLKMIQETKDKDAHDFIKQKVESANWFKNAIFKKRGNFIKSNECDSFYSRTVFLFRR